jgi:two-component system response regulator FlrC
MAEHNLPILVVEDDPSLREAIGDTLELARRSFVAVDGGEAALKRIGRSKHFPSWSATCG